MTTPRAVLITGGSRGIGRGLAARFLADGARVLVTGRSADDLARAAEDLPGLQTWAGDIGDAASRERLADHVLQVLPELDTVVQNAGGQRRVALAADTAPWAERDREVEVLFSAPVHLNHLLVPHLLGRPGGASVVVVTSGGAFVPQPFAPVYSAAKAALHSYTLNLRLALRGTSVRVVELVPPAVATGLSGLPEPHGVPVEDYVEAAHAALVEGSAEVIGFGPTDSEDFHRLVALQQNLFDATASRFPVATYCA